MTALQDLLEETKECHHSLLKQLFANCPVEVLQQMQLIRLPDQQSGICAAGWPSAGDRRAGRGYSLQLYGAAPGGYRRRL